MSENIRQNKEIRCFGDNLLGNQDLSRSAIKDQMGSPNYRLGSQNQELGNSELPGFITHLLNVQITHDRHSSQQQPLLALVPTSLHHAEDL